VSFAARPELVLKQHKVAVREGVVEHRGGSTWYRVVGTGLRTPLVCLHGGPGSTHNYFAPLEELARVHGRERGRPVVLYDQVGCGRSSRAADAAWSLELFLDELDALRAHLDLHRIHLLGSSWGGMLALEHALRRPGTLAGLVLSSTLASAPAWAAEARRLRDELPAEVRDVLDRHERAGTYDDPQYRGALAEFERRHFHRGDDGRPELQRMRAGRSEEAYRAMWGPNEWTMTGALAGWDVTRRLHELDVPVLVVRGAYDLCTEAIAAQLVEGIAGARLEVLAASSHTPVLEETERYLALVRAFLAEADGRPA